MFGFSRLCVTERFLVRFDGFLLYNSCIILKILEYFGYMFVYDLNMFVSKIVFEGTELIF